MTHKTPPTDRPARIAVLDDYMGVAHRLADWSVLEGRATVDFLTSALPSGREAETLKDYDAICLLRERMDVPGELLRQLPDLRAIVSTGRRNRTLDDATAQEMGIPIMTTSGSGNGVYATVELAWGLILSLMRHIPAESDAMRAGAWQTRMGNAIYGRTLGLVGLGRLGSRMAENARSFGMNVIAWSPNLTHERAAEAGAEHVDKETLFRTADVVSLHLVLAETTRGIVGADDLGRMKPEAILVNTSRGPLVDEAALLDALRHKRIRAAGIDVFEPEPLPADHPLRALPNALLTPHLGYAVEETLAAFYAEIVENLDGWLNGTPPRLLHPA